MMCAEDAEYVEKDNDDPVGGYLAVVVAAVTLVVEKKHRRQTL